ncbi:MAG TPA: DUF2997 domain-containing protein [Chloroflexota bacterium]|nr:DUF2997 domain-containing protein [Chloroflexota bacterium]
MPEIEFTIDSTTGKLDVLVKGMRGPSCGDVAKVVEEFLGKPTIDRNTSEYHLRPQVRPQIQPRRSR